MQHGWYAGLKSLSLTLYAEMGVLNNILYINGLRGFVCNFVPLLCGNCLAKVVIILQRTMNLEACFF